MADLAAYALTVLLSLAPPERARPPPGWEETPDAMRARYASIAADVAAVARTRTEAATLLGVAFHESGFAADVDAGRCFNGPGYEKRCDGGRAFGPWQMWGQAVRTMTRREQATEAWHRIEQSRRACRGNAPEETLAAFAGGLCFNEWAREAARGLDGAIRKALAVRVP